MSVPLRYGMILTACDEPVFVYVLLVDGTAKTIEVPPGQQWSKGSDIDTIVHIGRKEDDESQHASMIASASGSDYPAGALEPVVVPIAPTESVAIPTLADVVESQIVGNDAPPPLDNTPREPDPLPTVATTRRRR